MGGRVASPLAGPLVVLECLVAALLTWLALPSASVESWMGESILAEDLGVHVALKWQALRMAFEEWVELGLALLLGLVPHRRAASGSRA
jgi:hypothetical protein